MIYLLYGKDDYRVRETLRRLVAEAGGADPTGANTTALDGRSVTPAELLGHAQSMPFLADRRIVVVEGLLRALSESRGGGRRRKDDDPLTPWRDVAAALGAPASLPETTTLIFVEGDPDRMKAAFPVFAPVARSIDHPPLPQGELGDWITATSKELGLSLSARAVASLAQLIGPDLWTMRNELEKLAIYGAGAPVDEAAVADLVSAAREARIWDLTDAVVQGDERKALSAMRRLIADGTHPQQQLVMVAREYRQVMMFKDMRDRSVRRDEMASIVGVKSFRVGALDALASRFSWPALRDAYARILEADLRVKRGEADDEPSLQLLIHELCDLAPARRGARPARR